MNTTTTTQPFTRPFSFCGEEYTATEAGYQALRAARSNWLTLQMKLAELLESGEVTDEPV
jgi:hypothetical protein